MYPASDAFHNAIEQNAKQMAVLLFANAIFTNEDIDISSGGLTFVERFNESEEMTIGACPSSTLSFDLINEDRRLDGYRFGEFKALIGAMISDELYAYGNEKCMAVCYGDGWSHRITGHSEAPYLRVDGNACAVQPDFGVYGLFVNERDIYCFDRTGRVLAISLDENGSVAVRKPVDWETLQGVEWDDINATWQGISSGSENIINGFSVDKGRRIAESRTGVTLNGNHMQFWFDNGRTETYEMVPLGWFIADRPDHLDAETVSVEAQDRMKKFDVLLTELDPIPYPISAGNLLAFLCNQTGVSAVSTEFVNSGSVLNGEPECFRGATAADVLRYLAELAGSVARFNRAGLLELVWYIEPVKEIDEDHYENFSVCSYRVKSVSGVSARDVSSENETTIGADSNVYTITGNPFIGDGSQSGEQLTRLFGRLSGTKEFYPAAATVFDDWSMQAGDTLTVYRDGKPYRMPVYTQTLQWDGMPVMTVENSGSETIPVQSKQERDDYASEANQAEKMRQYGYGLSQTRDELNSYIEATDAELAALKDGTVSMWTQIYQSAEEIRLTASKVTSIDGRLSNAETLIRQTATDITLYAKKDEVSSYINISGDGITISSGTIRLNGTTIAEKIDVNKLISRFSSLSNVGISGILSVDGKFRFKGHNYIERNVTIGGTNYTILAWDKLDA